MLDQLKKLREGLGEKYPDVAQMEVVILHAYQLDDPKNE